MDRFLQCGVSIEQLVAQQEMVSRQYDLVGRDRFREYASLTAERLRLYREKIGKT
jgi:hypothetical protein